MSSFGSIERELVAAPQSSNRLVQILGGAAVLALLYVGRDVLIPFTLAGLLSLMLAQFVRRLQRLGFGRTASTWVAVSTVQLAIHRLVGVMILAGLTALGLAHAALLLGDGPVVSLPPRFFRRAHCNTRRRDLQGSAFLQ